VIRVVPHYVGDDLRGSALAVGLAVGAPALTAVVARPLGGHLADDRGPRLVVVLGAAAMVAGALPMLDERYPAFVASRLLVGIGEGAMMSAAVLWLLRLAGPERRGRALGHIGLANYAGLTVGPLLADLLDGDGHPTRVFVAAALLPLGCAAVAPFAQPSRPPRDRTEPPPLAATARLVLRPGVGLLLVNVGYAALLSFGAVAIGSAAVAVLPVYAVTVILVRTLGGSLPDRLGGARTLAVAAPVAAVGLVAAAFLPTWPALAGVAVLGVGQALAVPALGLLALANVPEERHGTASGVFFAWFDGGVALGGPFAGGVAALAGPGGALAASAAAVALAVPAAISRRCRAAAPARPCAARAARASRAGGRARG
jgi:MFS family permease